MPKLFLHFTVPIPVGQDVCAPALTFTRWLPLGSENAIDLTRDGVAVKLSFDMQCTARASQPAEDDLPKMVNVLAHRVHADVAVDKVSEGLVRHLRSRENGPAAEKAIQEEYEEVGARAVTVTLQTLNRLISYVHSQKGQYWLREYEIDKGRVAHWCSEFGAEALLDDERVPFRPNSTPSIKLWLESEDRYVRADEWAEVRSFVLSASRPPLAKVLLADAEALAAAGHRRSALIQALSALEVCLGGFASMDNTLGRMYAGRLGTAESLRKQIDHLGFSGSVKYLLPLLFPESDLPQHVVDDCRSALDQRNNVVHNGQRDVDDRLLQRSLVAIRKLMDLLERSARRAPAEE